MAEVVVRRGCRAHLAQRERVLHDEDEDLHTHAEPEAHDREVGTEHPDRQRRGHRGEQEQSDRGDRRSDDRQPLVPTGAADQLARDDRGEQQRSHHRDHQQPRLGRVDAGHHLQVGRQVGERAEHRNTNDETGDGGEVEVAVFEQVQRHDRLGGPALDHHEGDRGDDRADDERDDLDRIPGVGRAAPGAEQHQARRGEREQHHSGEVDARLRGGALGELQERDGGDDGEDAERDIHPQTPAPAGSLGEPAAQQRSGDRGQREDTAHDAHVAAALPGRHDIRDDRLRQDHQPATAETLDGAPDDELGHGVGHAAHDRADDEERDRGDEQALTADQVTELAVDRQHDRGRENVGGGDPEHLVDSV